MILERIDQYTYKQEVDDAGNHRIVRSDGETSEWTTYTFVARLDDVRSTTKYWGDKLPRLFEVRPL